MAGNIGGGNGDRSRGGKGNNNNNKGHDHSNVSNPAYEPGNPLQVLPGCVKLQKNIQLYQYQEYMDLPMTNSLLDYCLTVTFNPDGTMPCKKI
jgi:hypothetical protein